jgi:hypothetical protein
LFQGVLNILIWVLLLLHSLLLPQMFLFNIWIRPCMIV